MVRKKSDLGLLENPGGRLSQKGKGRRFLRRVEVWGMCPGKRGGETLRKKGTSGLWRKDKKNQAGKGSCREGTKVGNVKAIKGCGAGHEYKTENS